MAAVEKEAGARNISPNTLVNQILKRFAEFERFAERINTVQVSGAIFRNLLSGVEEGTVIEVAKSTGSSIPQAFVNSKGDKVAEDSLVDYLRLSSTYSRLFEFNENENLENHLITLVHEFGLNWSIFLVHYLTAMFEQVGISLKLDMSDRSVTFNLPRQM
jgi:hypothetical protein